MSCGAGSGGGLGSRGGACSLRLTRSSDSTLKKIMSTAHHDRSSGIQIRLGGASLPDNSGADLMNHIVEMDECITVRVPRGTSLALERAAIGAHSRSGQLARRMLLDGLRASGFELAPRFEFGAEVLDFR